MPQLFENRYLPSNLDLRELILEGERAKRARGIGQPPPAGITQPPPGGIGPQSGEIMPDTVSALQRFQPTLPEFEPALEPSAELLKEATEADLAGAGAQEPADLGAGTYSQISNPLARELQNRISQPATEQVSAGSQTGEKPGFLSRLGSGLKAALHEGLTAVRLGAPGYKALQLQKELYPLKQTETAAEMKSKLGYEQKLSPIQEALQRSLITHRASEEARFTQPKTPVKETVSDLQHAYLVSLSEADRNALLKRSLMRGQTLAEGIDELTGNQPATSGGIPGGNWFPGNEPANPTPFIPGATPVAPAVPTATPAMPGTVPTKPAVNPEDKAGIIQLLKEQGFNDNEIAETLKSMGY